MAALHDYMNIGVFLPEETMKLPKGLCLLRLAKSAVALSSLISQPLKMTSSKSASAAFVCSTSGNVIPSMMYSRQTAIACTSCRVAKV